MLSLKNLAFKTTINNGNYTDCQVISDVREDYLQMLKTKIENKKTSHFKCLLTITYQLMSRNEWLETWGYFNNNFWKQIQIEKWKAAQLGAIYMVFSPYHSETTTRKFIIEKSIDECNFRMSYYNKNLWFDEMNATAFCLKML